MTQSTEATSVDFSPDVDRARQAAEADAADLQRQGARFLVDGSDVGDFAGPAEGDLGAA